MPRRNSGPRLRFLEKRGAYYIVWTDAGRSRERSTGTEDRSRAEIALAEFLKQRSRSAGPCDPSEILVTDVLADYAEEHGQVTAAQAPCTSNCEFASRHGMNAGVAQATQFCHRYLTTLILWPNPRGFKPHPGMRLSIRAAPGGGFPGRVPEPTTITGAADFDASRESFAGSKPADARARRRAQATFSPSRHESVRSWRYGS